MDVEAVAGMSHRCDGVLADYPPTQTYWGGDVLSPWILNLELDSSITVYT